MDNINVLVTGGYGCIGAETTKWLIRNTSASVVVGSRSVSAERSERVFWDVDRSRIEFVATDVRDRAQLERVLVGQGITHVVHMAALQTPDCNANRDLGLQINLAGTQNLMEAVKGSGVRLQRFLFASSIAVYGPRAAYPQERVPMLAEPQPVNVYGAWKLAGESLARFFAEETGVPTLSIRPGVLYGPGRDAGLTSTPTTAIKCVALGIPYRIPFHSRQDYQFAPDVGAAIGIATTSPFAGYNVFTLPGRSLDSEQLVAALRIAAEQLGVLEQFQITIGGDSVPFICDLEYQPFLEAFQDVPRTDLESGMRQSLEVYLEQVRRGWLLAESIAV